MTTSPLQLLLWALGRRRRVRVSGPSMAPTLRPGAHVLVDPRAYRRRPPAVGDVVLARHPHTGAAILKRIAGIGPQGVDLRGDNPDLSTDSREFGPVPTSAVAGRVVSLFPG